MPSPFSRAVPALTTSLFVAACQDTTQPISDDVRTPPQLSKSSGDVECDETLPPGTYKNIIVPTDGVCFVENSVVRGNITVLEDGSLFVFTSRVQGSVQGQGADFVSVEESEVFGNVRIQGGGHPEHTTGVFRGTVHGNVEIREGTYGEDVFVSGVTLPNGNVKVEDNFIGRGLFIDGTNVRGNMEVRRTTGPADKRVTGNTVAGSLQCFDNDAPFTGGPNTAQKAEGQCF
jgi:hypothetical protein